MRNITPIILAAVLAMGCDNKNDEIEGDTGVDTASDPAVDTGTDLIPDPTTDPGEDSSADTVVADTEEDATPDATPDAVTGGPEGDPCVDAEDCGGMDYPTCLTMLTMGGGGALEFTNGYCSGDCTESSNCGPDAVCEEMMGGMQLCLLSCVDDSDCREEDGYGCRLLMGERGPYCFPPRPPRPDVETDAPTDAPTDMSTDMPSDVPFG